MATVLHIQASPMRNLSYSLRAAQAFLESYLASHPGDKVATLDLSKDALPEFDFRTASGKYRILHGEKHTKEEARAWQKVERVIEELKKADKLVVSSPMWNFGIPYRLKQYLDVIMQPGYTFSYTPAEGYKGLVTGRPAMLILARGGEYKPGTQAAVIDFQKPYLEFALQFIGFTKIDSIVIEPTLMQGPKAADQKLAEAIELARSKAGAF